MRIRGTHTLSRIVISLFLAVCMIVTTCPANLYALARQNADSIPESKPEAGALAPQTILSSKKEKVFNAARWLSLHKALSDYMDSPSKPMLRDTLSAEAVCDILEIDYFYRRWLPDRYLGRKPGREEAAILLNDYLEELTAIENTALLDFNAQELDVVTLFKKLRRITETKRYLEGRWFFLGYDFASRFKKDENPVWGSLRGMLDMINDPQIIARHYPEHKMIFNESLGHCYAGYKEAGIKIENAVKKRLPTLTLQKIKHLYCNRLQIKESLVPLHFCVF